MKRIHILENAFKYLLDEGRNAEKAKLKTIAVIKNYLSQNGVQDEQLEAMAMEYEHSFKEWLFHANMPDSIIRLEPIMANVAMQLGFTPQNRSTRELYRLKDITNYIIANYNKEDFPIALNKLTLDNTTFESLNELFGSAIDTSKGVWKPSNDGKPKPHYTVKRLDTFEEANKYYPYTQNICYLVGENTWNHYTDEGQNAVYVLLRDGWEDIPAEHGEGTPYDDYGESMVFVIIRPDGDVAYTNTRWNHNANGQGPRDVDQSFRDKMGEISDMLQTDYRNILIPYTEEELAERGIITLSMLHQWFPESKDILEMCKDSDTVLRISDDLFKIVLTNKKIMLYNSHLNKLMPYDNAILQYMAKFKEGYAAIQRNDGKLSFINTHGEQIGGWYKNVWNFENGFAKVQRDDYKVAYINTEGQQIGGWYKNVWDFENGFAKVQRDDYKVAYINTDGKQIGDWCTNIYPFNNGFAKVQRDDGKWSIINTDGEQVCDWFWKLKLDYNYNYIVTTKEDCKIINLQNKILLGPYSYIDNYSDKNKILLARRKDGKSALFNGRNYNQISNWYTSIKPFLWPLILVKNENGMVSLINADGKQICDWCTNIYPFNNGFAKVQRGDGKRSFINIKGQQIGDWYDEISDFKNGFARVQRDDGKWSIINTDGEQVCDWYRMIWPFYNGYATVQRDDGKWYDIDTHGNLYDKNTKQPISVQNETYMRLSNLISEALHSSIRDYLLYN